MKPTRKTFFDKNILFTINGSDGIPFGFFKYQSERDVALKRHCKFGMAGKRKIPLERD